MVQTSGRGSGQAVMSCSSLVSVQPLMIVDSNKIGSLAFIRE
jgi:hypothetical protein